MKANTPEKIYVSYFDIEALPKNERLSERWHEVSTQDTDIEYTRTDAFVEKAVEWLSNNLAKETSVIASGIVSVDFKNVIEQFQKAMKL